MIDEDQLDSSEFYDDETKKYRAMIRRLDEMEPPSCMVGGNQSTQTQEEIDFYKTISHAKSNLRIIKGVGSMCKCGHGKVAHILESGFYSNWLVCKKKTCKCINFCKK